MAIEYPTLKTDAILFEVEGNVAKITFNKPENYNPLNADAMDDIGACLLYCENTDEIRAIVFTGAGKAFTAGGDVKGMQARNNAGINNTKSNIRHGGEMLNRLRSIRKPTIAAINGPCAGVGVSVALACDFSIAKEDVTMSLAFIGIGFIPDGGIIPMLCKAVGTVRATDLLMSGRRFKAKEAAEMGLVTTAVPAEEFEETVEKYVKKYANGPSIAYEEMKMLMYNAMYSDIPATLQREVYAQYRCASTDDHKEAVNAFVEKRKPNFQGK